MVCPWDPETHEGLWAECPICGLPEEDEEDHLPCEEVLEPGADRLAAEEVVMNALEVPQEVAEVAVDALFSAGLLR